MASWMATLSLLQILYIPIDVGAAPNSHGVDKTKQTIFHTIVHLTQQRLPQQSSTSEAPFTNMDWL